MLVNGRSGNCLPLADRAIHYGDGAFETVLVHDSTPRLWRRHLERLKSSCALLRIPCDFTALENEVQLILAPHRGPGILKIIVSRGQGGRGYTPPEHPETTRILQMHTLPSGYDEHATHGIEVLRCQHPLSSNPVLAGHKHLNRLDQVMASLELESRHAEGLMCDSDDNLIEGIKSNVFVVIDNKIVTPDLTFAGVAGIMRAMLIELFASRATPAQVRPLKYSELVRASEVFVCNSVFGVWPVVRVNTTGSELNFKIGKTTRSTQVWLKDVL